MKKEKVEQVFDVLLSSVFPERVPDKLGWRIAELVRDGKLYTRKGAKLVVKAASLCEPSKTKEILGRRR